MGNIHSCFHHLKEVEKKENVEYSGGGVGERIESSKSHWSILDVVEGGEVAEVSNLEEFLALQRHPTFGSFFATYYGEGENVYDLGELVVGEKFAEGGQAELYDCKVKLSNPDHDDFNRKARREFVLKVFKKGTYLRQIKSQLPQGLLQFHIDEMRNWKSPTPILERKCVCRIHGGTLLKDGRFAFLMDKEHFDLRHLIDENMKVKTGKDRRPFSKEDIELIMFEVAWGVDWLHRRDIVHRDLKASNVLVKRRKCGWPKWRCMISDYECSVGVVGTGFFRAPEILQACKERKLGERPEVFSKATDIYGYGMICYEVMTGKIPFEGCLLNDYDHVLRGDRPLVPKHAKDWIHELLDQCWQSDPRARPSTRDILSMILAHSRPAREFVELYKRDFLPSIMRDISRMKRRS